MLGVFDAPIVYSQKCLGSVSFLLKNGNEKVIPFDRNIFELIVFKVFRETKTAVYIPQKSKATVQGSLC